MAKRGFSKMMWGGGVIILVAVLFFVSVYGVREGFKTITCKQGTVIPGPIFYSIGAQVKNGYLMYSQYMNCYYKSCSKNSTVSSNKGSTTCYSGTVQNDTDDITQAGLTATTYTPIAATSPNTGSTWQAVTR